jgi:predicted amino acid racemase
MFLEPLRRRNPALIADAVALHRAGELPANSYVIDLDAVQRNAERMAREAEAHGLELLAMTKQVGRGAPFAAALRAGGIERCVAVDMDCALANHAGGLRVGNLGHLVQVPFAEVSAAAALEPENWTVFNLEKAREASAASARLGRAQDFLIRVHADGDIFYPGHEGGFAADDAEGVADALDELDGGRFAGITSFPALLFDEHSGTVEPTPNLQTLHRVAERLARSGRSGVRLNAPGTTSSAVFGLLATFGATQVEPGHGLTGTTPLHAVRDLPEEPALLYLTEVSHRHAGRAYCFGGGLYIDPVFAPYELKALVAAGPDPEQAFLVEAEIPPPEAIDYYGMLTSPRDRVIGVGDTVIFGFRAQAFVTRASVVGVRGAGTGRADVAGIWTADGRELDKRKGAWK